MPPVLGFKLASQSDQQFLLVFFDIRTEVLRKFTREKTDQMQLLLHFLHRQHTWQQGSLNTATDTKLRLISQQFLS